MTNNFKLIKQLFNFDNTGDTFYFAQILKRRKDNTEMSKHVKVIKSYYIDSLEYFNRKEDEMISLADKENARLMINLNSKSYKKVALKTLIDMAQKIDAGQYKSIRSSYDSSAGKYNTGDQKRWIIDIDREDYHTTVQTTADIEEIIYNSNPEGSKIIEWIPSKTGVHLITRPFDARHFSKIFPFLEIKKNNPTNLYIP